MRRTTTLFAALCCVCVITPSALAEVIVVEPAHNSGADADFERAKASSADANKAYEADDIPTALAHAEAAYRSYPNASTAMQMANIYVAAKNHPKAFRWFLLARNHNPPESFVSKIENALKTHGGHAKLAVVLLKTSPGKAAVDIDGDGKTVGGRYVGLSFGEHTLNVSAKDHTAASQKVTVSAAGITTASVSLKAVEKVADPVAPKQEAGSIVVPLALVISGAVLAGGGAGLLVWGLGNSSDAKTGNGGFDPNTDNEAARDDYTSMRSNAEVGSYAGYAMLGVGGALLVTGAVLWAMTPSGPEGEGTADVTVSPSILRGGAGIFVGGAF